MRLLPVTVRALIALSAIATLATINQAPAFADAKADRAAVIDAVGKLATIANDLAATAKKSDDRGARKKFAPAATELGDDLAAFARRLAKDVPAKSLIADATGIDKDAQALVELADEAEDKEERKEFRKQAVLIQQATAAVKKLVEQVVAQEDSKDAKPVQRYTGRLFNNTDDCDLPENVKFVLSRDGQRVFTANMVFPGKSFELAVEKGRYNVQILDTTDTFLAQRTLDANVEGWTLSSGCVKDD